MKRIHAEKGTTLSNAKITAAETVIRSGEPVNLVFNGEIHHISRLEALGIFSSEAVQTRISDLSATVSRLQRTIQELQTRKAREKELYELAEKFRPPASRKKPRQ